MKRDIMYKDARVATVYLNRDTINPTAVDVHLDIHQWSVEIYKEFLMVLETIKDGLRGTEVEKLCTVVPASDPRKVHFVKMIGFYNLDDMEYMGQKLVYAEMEV
jgi:Fe-S-cluster formation regulator IscX/YfhJ